MCNMFQVPPTDSSLASELAAKLGNMAKPTSEDVPEINRRPIQKAAPKKFIGISLSLI